MLNVTAVNNLLKAGSSYDKVVYENQLIPEKDENGKVHYEITTPVISTALIEGKAYTLSPGKHIF